MAKKGTSTVEQQLAAIQATQQKLMDDTKAELESVQYLPKESKRPKAAAVAGLVKSAQTRNTRANRVAVDLTGGTIAQASTELINWGVRAMARWSGRDGIIGSNADLLQGGPHFLLGLGIYITEMATRSNDPMKLPSTTRDVISEASKLFAQLGFSNLARAVRIRWTDTKRANLDREALIAENKEIRAKLAEQQAKKA